MFFYVDLKQLHSPCLEVKIVLSNKHGVETSKAYYHARKRIF